MFNAEEMAHKLSEFWALVDVTSAHFGHWLTLGYAALQPFIADFRRKREI